MRLRGVRRKNSKLALTDSDEHKEQPGEDPRHVNMHLLLVSHFFKLSENYNDNTQRMNDLCMYTFLL